jgi:hypothetical protein
MNINNYFSDEDDEIIDDDFDSLTKVNSGDVIKSMVNNKYLTKLQYYIVDKVTYYDDRAFVTLFGEPNHKHSTIFFTELSKSEQRKFKINHLKQKKNG